MLNIYPNPFKNKLIIKGLTLFNNKTHIKLFDITGKEVFICESCTEIDLPESILPGAYILKVTDSNGKTLITNRLMKIQ